MNLLWLDLNCSYAHSSLALPAIHAQKEDKNSFIVWDKIQATINSNISGLLVEIINKNPDIIAVTAWLFTHEYLLKIISRVKRIKPDCIVIIGGPEMLGDNEEYLRRNNFIDCVFRGEGEIEFHHWLSHVNDKSKWKQVKGLCYIDGNGKYIDNGIAKVPIFEQLNYPESSKFFDWSKPFVQLETSRGCFNSCSFCVSGNDKPVRSIPVAQIRERLENIYSHGIKEIRLLDRTFNGDIIRAVELLKLFPEFSNRLHFHLEIHPALLNNKLKEILQTLPENLLHIEAGIQSLDQQVLKSCHRMGKIELCMDGLKYLSSLPNLIVHADLIAGLPHYRLNRIFKDIKTLIAFGTQEIQLESLKVLPGTRMKEDADQYGLVYSTDPPYEVLKTQVMSIQDMRRAMNLSKVIDWYYNTYAWQNVIAEIILNEESFLNNFLLWLENKDVFENPLSLEKRGLLLYEYCELYYPEYLIKITKSWILAGIPMTKEPSKKITAWTQDLPHDINLISGNVTDKMRFYSISDNSTVFWFGFDRAISPSKPIFVAYSKL